ncbi:MAG: NAD(P)-binding protein [Gammaproteobacteria bacterium]|nr:NAD(P)-binding protein [Gammaproteobacteria bacterium]
MVAIETLRSSTNGFDYAVIGAGAAGISAARTLSAAGRRVVVLEALSRIGGRAFTETISGYPFDWGCHWLHSGSRNVLRLEADRLGVRYGHPSIARRLRMPDGTWADAAMLAERSAYTKQCDEAAVRAARKSDVALARVLPDHDRWNPWQRMWLTLLCSFEAEEISVVDYARYEDTLEDWPVLDGYGALIEKLASSLDIRTQTEVRTVTRSADGVILKGAFGELRVKGMVVTASTSALAAERIRFTPALPHEVTEAFHHIPVGRANKILFPIVGDAESFPEAANLVDLRRLPQALSFYCRPYGRALIVAHSGGHFAAALEAAGERAAVAEAHDQLKDLLGTQVLKHLGDGRASAWGQIPSIRGAYASARPGHGHRRQVLATPFDERLQLAGEACSMPFYSTAHGAFESGAAAAARLL